MGLRTGMTALVSLLLLGCAAQEPLGEKNSITKAATAEEHERPSLASNLDATAFKAALIGKWDSVWANPSGNYVKRLILEPGGKASIAFVREKTEQTIEGQYSVTFIRLPSPSMVTLAEVTIIPSTGKPVVLSRVNFGLHNAVLLSRGPFLRIDKSQFGSGVLERSPDR